MTVLEAISLTKIYGRPGNEVTALDNVSYAFAEGSFTAVTGRSGSGKSTLLQLLGGLMAPSGGRVLLDGEDLSLLDDEQRTVFRRERIGFIFQSFNLVPELNAYENIILPLKLGRRRIDRRYIDGLIDALGLGDRLTHYSDELSGGQCQRVAIARALAADPSVILADEPTGNLDEKNSREVMELLKKANREFGKTIVLVTHDPEAAGYADSAIRLVDGRQA